MAPFEQSIVSVSGRLGHQWDFAFYKNNGEIANLLRVKLGSIQKDMRMDKDGDIEIELEDIGTCILTPSAVIAVAWLTNPTMLSAQPEVEKFANLIEQLAEFKGSFTPDFYSIRLFFRFRPENSLNLLRDRGFESSLRLIIGEKVPSDVTSFKFSTTRGKGKFHDSIELEASSKDVQLRYSRSGNGADFDSYSTFMAAANLPELSEELKPFAETLIAAEPRGLNLSRGLLSEMK